MTDYIVKMQGRILIDMLPDALSTVTVGHVRRWLDVVDQYGVDDNTELVEGMLSLDIVSDTVEASMCAECAPRQNLYDALVTLHKCVSYAQDSKDHSH